MKLFHIKKEGSPKKLGLNLLEKTKRTLFGFDITIPIWFFYKMRYQDWLTEDVMEGNLFYCLSFYLRKRHLTKTMVPSAKTWIFKVRTGWRKAGEHELIYPIELWLDNKRPWFGYLPDFRFLRKL